MFLIELYRFNCGARNLYGSGHEESSSLRLNVLVLGVGLRGGGKKMIGNGHALHGSVHTFDWTVSMEYDVTGRERATTTISFEPPILGVSRLRQCQPNTPHEQSEGKV